MAIINKHPPSQEILTAEREGRHKEVLMDEYTTILDYDGNKVEVGSKVRFYDDAPPLKNSDEGEIIEISDFEGDVDDDTGRSRVIEPSIKVRWADGEEQEYNTSEWEYREVGWVMTEDGPEPEAIEATGKVEELMVMKP